MIRIPVRPVCPGRFLNKFGIRSLRISSHCRHRLSGRRDGVSRSEPMLYDFVKNYGRERMIRAFLRKLGIIPGFEF
ncbi:protein of unknown function [Pseudomonas mediterranea]